MANKKSKDGGKNAPMSNLFDFSTGERIQSEKKRIGIQTTVFDADTGEILRDQTRLSRSDNGKDWNIMYQLTLYQLATDKTLTRADLATYMYILANMDYQCKFATTKRDMAEKLHLSYRQMLASLEVLKKRDYIRESRVNGISAFFANPEYATRGKDKGKLLKAYDSIPQEVIERISEQAAVTKAVEEALESF